MPALRILALLFVFGQGCALHRIVTQPLDPIQPLNILFQYQAPTYCTVFSINEPMGYWLTARHCIEDKTAPLAILIDNAHAEVLFKSLGADLAVLRSATKAPALYLAEGPPTAGDAIEIRSAFRRTIKGHVLAHYLLIGHPGFMRWEISDVLHARVEPGESGSPVLAEGRVAGLLWGGIQGADHSISVAWEMLNDQVGIYWEKAGAAR